MKKFLMCLVVVAVVVAFVKGKDEGRDTSVPLRNDTSAEKVTYVVEDEDSDDVFTGEEDGLVSGLTEETVEEKTTEELEEENDGIVDDIIDPTFKEAMDSYETFFDKYIAFMKKFNDAEPDEMLGLMGSYSEYMAQYAETMKKLDDINQEELNAAESLYYAEVSARISKKLLEVEY